MQHQFIRFLFSFVLTLLATATLTGRACADEAFTVAGVHVDASAPSSAGARNAAIADGRIQAWQTLYRRLTLQQDWPRQPKLNAEQLQRYVSSYFPTLEKRSTTRYVADVTYIFSREAVARLLQSAKIAYTATQAKRVLLIPLAPGYVQTGKWTAAFFNPKLQGGMIPFVLPSDAQDAAALGGLTLKTATWSDVAETAAKRGATEVVLVEAVPAADKMLLTLKRLGPHQAPLKLSTEIEMLPGGGASTYASGADTAVRTMEELWKSHTAVDFSRRTTLTADMRIDTGLEDFVKQHKRLLAIPTITEANIQALSTTMARLQLIYQGTSDQLQEALAQNGFSLTRENDGWLLAPGGRKADP